MLRINFFLKKGWQCFGNSLAKNSFKFLKVSDIVFLKVRFLLIFLTIIYNINPVSDTIKIVTLHFNFNSALPTSLLIAPGLLTIQFLFLSNNDLKARLADGATSKAASAHLSFSVGNTRPVAPSSIMW
jgi:hypothetical protein